MKFFLLRWPRCQLSLRSAPVFPIAGSDSDLARVQSDDPNFHMKKKNYPMQENELKNLCSNPYDVLTCPDVRIKGEDQCGATFTHRRSERSLASHSKEKGIAHAESTSKRKHQRVSRVVLALIKTKSYCVHPSNNLSVQKSCRGAVHGNIRRPSLLSGAFSRARDLARA